MSPQVFTEQFPEGKGRFRLLRAALDGGLHGDRQLQQLAFAFRKDQIEAALGSARSVASTRSARSLKPPQSPNYGLLRGMEISARSVESAAARKDTLQARRSAGLGLPSPGAVGVAF